MVQSPTDRTTEPAVRAAPTADRRKRARKRWNVPRGSVETAHRDGLDWDSFRDLYYPDTRRHNLEAIVAYGEYRRSDGPRPVRHHTHLKGDPISAGEAVSLEEWEDEGGASH
jgi:hypothetical protein